DAELDRIGAHHEHDGNGRGGGLGRERRWQRGAEDDRDPAAHELGGLRGEPTVVALRPAVFNGEIGTLGISRLGETLAQRGEPPRVRACRLAAEIPNHRHLLRARRERPRRSAAEKRHELAALHSITSSARWMNGPGIARPSAFAVLRLRTSWNLAESCTGSSPGLPPLRIRSMYDAARRYVSAKSMPYDMNPPLIAKKEPRAR